jgi:ankyrin repeat protein
MAKRATLAEDEARRLQKALRADDVETVRGFLGGGLDLKAKLEVDGAPFGPLHEAASRGAADVVRLLLDAGADVDRKVNGATPLMDTCLGCGSDPKRHRVAEILLAAGADPNALSGADEGDSGLTALMYAAESGGTEMIRLLLAAGANPSILTRHGRSAVNFALERMHGRPDTMSLLRVLIEGGCPATGACLVCPVGEGNTEIVQYLIAAGADVNARTNKFDDFRRHGPGSSLVSLGLQGAVNAGMEKEPSVHDPQARLRYVQILKSLVQAGADVNSATSGVPPLTVAAAYGGDVEMVKLLLELGADPKARSDSRLATALHAAAGYGHVEIARILLDAGADVNALAPRNKTPLDEAIQNQRAEVADLLRQTGGREGTGM